MTYSYNSKFYNELHHEILELIKSDIDICDEDKFNDLALREFQYQFYNNNLYRKYCEEKFNIQNPECIESYTDIPAVPNESFKLEENWISFPKELLPKAKLFQTSGTTSGKKGKFWMDPKSRELFDLALIKANKEYCFLDVEKIKIYFTASPPDLVPNAGIGYDMNLIRENFATESSFWMDKEGFHAQKVTEELKKDEKTDTSVLIMGPSFGFVLFYDWCRERNINFELPIGSRIVDGAGYRGISREVPKTEFLAMMSELFDIPEIYILNNYACSETNLMLYDNTLRNYIKGRYEPRYKSNYPWTRIKVVDMDRYPEETVFLDEGKRGLLRYYTLTNLGAIMCIQTDDTGELIGRGFEIYGKSKPVKTPLKLKLV